MSMVEYRYSLYGTAVRYETDVPILAQPVNELLRHFRLNDAFDADAVLTLRFRQVKNLAEVPFTISASARQLAAGTGEAVGDRRATGLAYKVSADQGLLIAEFPEIGVLVIDGAQGQAEGYVINPERLSSNLIEYLFHLALIELLRRRGLYTIHATALEYSGRAILIPGNSGRGKTTSFISLLRSGYRYLSDDHPLLQDSGAQVEVLPFPIKINVTDATVQFFPELQSASEQVLHPGVPKRFFYAEDLYRTAVGERCQPALVLFPHVVDAPKSHLELLPKSRALEALLPQALLVYDQEVARREFKVLAKLVQQVDCYRLHFGRDILDLPKLITPLLEKGR
ncbi:MAG: hypothetical protein LZF86_160064 [Nitrospira sp.]|nr:MAG: hypothetical protein LZF86_160064 [Nitrospira sp.]